MIAYCYRSGEIKFGYYVPIGAIAIRSGPAKKRRVLVSARARLSRADNKTIYVPGIPEAKSDDEAMAALDRFIEWIGSTSITK